jgi:hypothetical protein
MFVFAIETNGKTVAFTKETDRVMLDGVLNGQRAEGQQLREGLLYISKTGASAWDGVSPFTARLADYSEEIEYDVTAGELNMSGDSVLLFPVSERDGARFSGMITLAYKQGTERKRRRAIAA